MLNQQYFQQLHNDCEILKMRNSTPKAKIQHECNELTIYCRLVDYYKQYFSKEDAVWYAKRGIENLIRPTLEKKLKEGSKY
jgi:hypothetical protein